MQKNTSRLTTELIIGICGVILGLVSLVFAWQANQIARETNSIMSRQITDNVVVLTSETEASYNTEGPPERLKYEYKCSMRSRIANQGGASTSIIKYAATIFYRGMVIEAKSTGDVPTEHILIATVPFTSRDTETNINILLKGQGSNELESNRVEPPSPLPIAINPFSAIDLNTEVILFTKDLIPHVNIEDMLGDTGVKGQIQDSISRGYSHVEIETTYYTSSGKKVTSPNRVVCFLVKLP